MDGCPTDWLLGLGGSGELRRVMGSLRGTACGIEGEQAKKLFDLLSDIELNMPMAIPEKKEGNKQATLFVLAFIPALGHFAYHNAWVRLFGIASHPP